MKKTCIFLFVGISFLTSSLSVYAKPLDSLNNSNQSPQSSEDLKYVRGEVIVVFKSGVVSNQKVPLALSKNAVVTESFIVTNNKKQEACLMKLKADKSVETAVSELQDDPSVDYVQPNYIYHLCSMPNDTDFPKLWGLKNTGQTVNNITGTPGADIDMPEAWDAATGTNTIIVAVLDTGVDINHPDLEDGIWTNSKEIAGDGTDNDDNGYIDDINGWNFVENNNETRDYNEHGSHVAGIIGAINNNGIGVTGFSSKIKIMPVRAGNVLGEFRSLDIYKGVRYAVANGAKVINASFGGSEYDTLVYNAILYANNNNVLFIAAAGNGGSDILGDSNDDTPTYPSSYNLPNIISVAAADQNDNLASFSNYGINSVDVAAPGVNIYSTIPAFSYGSPFAVYSQNFDSTTVGQRPTGWISNTSSDWKASSSSYTSSPNCLEDSPGRNYYENSSSYIYYNSTFTYQNYNRYKANYKIKYSLEKTYDYSYLVLSQNKKIWYRLISSSMTGTSNGAFINRSINITNFISGYYFGFALTSDAGTNEDGVYIDDFSITKEPISLGSHSYDYLNGTSMAAPYVAGLAAFMLSTNPSLAPSVIKSIIIAKCDQKASLTNKVVSNGRINAYRAIRSLMVNRSLPTLTFAGVNNYVSDYVYPNKGNNKTIFTFKVKYIDPLNKPAAAGYPKLTVLGNTPIEMMYSSGSYATGAIYCATTTISHIGDYRSISYKIQAYDYYGDSVTSVSGTGPSYSNSADIQGFVLDKKGNGVPGISVNLSGYKFKTTTTDSGGSYLFEDVMLDKSYVITPTSINYSFLPSSCTYSYYAGNLSSQCFVRQIGKSTLLWADDLNYKKSAVYPKDGFETTNFVFRIKYRNAVADEPLVNYPKLHILQDSSEIQGSPFVLRKEESDLTDYKRGVIYKEYITLSKGCTYNYFIECYDVFGTSATGSASSLLAGPFVSALTLPQSGNVSVVGPARSKGVINPDKGDKAQIYFNSNLRGKFTCKIFSVSGNLLFEETKSDVNNGYFEWIPKDIASGVYIVCVQGPGVDQRKKMVVLR
ncbi:MAG: S8 family serine peptidase [Elusimicrobia bacterium]|nr:S8 family serine peptidase [Candidatus Liberimonas magnetica]